MSLGELNLARKGQSQEQAQICLTPKHMPFLVFYEAFSVMEGETQGDLSRTSGFGGMTRHDPGGLKGVSQAKLSPSPSSLNSVKLSKQSFFGGAV